MILFRVPVPFLHFRRLRAHREDMAKAVPRHDADGVKEPATEGLAATLETSRADEAGTEGKLVKNNTVALIVENCTECNKELPGEFFACMSCPGESATSFTIYPLTEIISAESDKPILILCDECAFKHELTKVGFHHSFADHFLVLVRNRNASYIHGEPEPTSKNKSEEEEPTIKSLQAQISRMLELIEKPKSRDKSADAEPIIRSLQAQMSKMLELIEKLTARVAPELLSSHFAAT